jgi:uncharacterized iron-regulated membrane protein
MKQLSFTQSMSWLHTWGGLLFGWVLYAIFFTGTLAVFDKEIDVWMQPELPAQQVDPVSALQRGMAYLERQYPGASAWNIGLPNERSTNLTVSAGQQRRGGGERLDPATGERIDVRETAGGQFFFHFHYTLNLPRMIGIWAVGLAAMAMLVALVSGIVIHKKFFKEFFTFRPAKGQRSWLDAHNASAVLLLPFHLMITYTGLVIFFLIYMPAAMDVLFDGERQGGQRAARGAPAEQQAGRGDERGGQGEHSHRSDAERRVDNSPAVALTDLALVLATAERAMGPVGGLSIQNPGRSDARIEVRPVLGNRIELTKGKSMQFDGVSGAVLRAPPESRPSQLTQRVMAGLHFAQFGGYSMRWLYFVCGLLSSAMIATGLVLYTVKRRRKYASETPLGQQLYRLVESLNVATIAGLAVACIGLLWLNRLLPVELAQRAGWEVRGFFALWLLSLLHAWLRPRMQAWREQLSLAALLCLGLPLFSVVSNGHAWAGGTRLWLELTVVLLGLLLAWGVWRLGQPVKQRSPRKQQPIQAQVN